MGHFQLTFIERWLLYRGRLQCLLPFGSREVGCFREVTALHSDHLRQVPLYIHTYTIHIHTNIRTLQRRSLTVVYQHLYTIVCTASIHLILLVQYATYSILQCCIDLWLVYKGTLYRSHTDGNWSITQHTLCILQQQTM